MTALKGKLVGVVGSSPLERLIVTTEVCYLFKLVCTNYLPKVGGRTLPIRGNELPGLITA